QILPFSGSLVALHYLKNDLIIAVDVILDANTAHPRLKVSEDGKSVTDTGMIRRVPVKKERFDCQAFVLAKEGYKSGRRYWEVDVGRRSNWILGVAQETVTRKGEVVLSPQNGFWAIALSDEQEYGVHTDPWTRLTVSGRPRKIGIFLDISAKKLSFYNVRQKQVIIIIFRGPVPPTGACASVSGGPSGGL
uniref:B30.2/SPRY domain-containing protein n=1 Tax=Anas zonorhyncha TaxID=75864 RepID=A0A8B9ZUE5_9AVES